MNELTVNEIKIENMIYEIRGKQIMLDSYLAKLYQVETKRINEAVKNNPDKFPDRFSWKLTTQESEIFLVENFDLKLICSSSLTIQENLSGNLSRLFFTASFILFF